MAEGSVTEKLRHIIADLIAQQKAHTVPGICAKYGMARGDQEEAFRSKYNYVKRRLDELSNEEVLKVAYKVRIDYTSSDITAVLLDNDRQLQIKLRAKPYYSIRTGKNPLSNSLDLPAILEQFKALYSYLNKKGYFDEAFGFECVDAGFVAGALGDDIDAALFVAIRKKNLTPIYDKASSYGEDDFFDIIEFLYDHCSRPIHGAFHNYADCGWHWEQFDRELGRTLFREQVNQILASYRDGYELSPDGDILVLADEGLSGLFGATVPTRDPANIGARVAAAVTKFRRSRASLEDRRDAVRDLADVLEYLRPQLKKALHSKDENALFDIANNFGIRHHNKSQQTDYDKPVWYSWIFYFYLATIHAATRLIERQNKP